MAVILINVAIITLLMEVLYSLVMIKYNSKVKLVATDKKVHTYQMKIVSYPNLPIFKTTQ